jgi:hypothetical protein
MKLVFVDENDNWGKLTSTNFFCNVAKNTNSSDMDVIAGDDSSRSVMRWTLRTTSSTSWAVELS